MIDLEGFDPGRAGAKEIVFNEGTVGEEVSAIERHRVIWDRCRNGQKLDAFEEAAD